VLKFQAHDIPAAAQLPAAQAPRESFPKRAKYFSTADVLETAEDRAWLIKMSNAISQH
jgi:hypothetical protein